MLKTTATVIALILSGCALTGCTEDGDGHSTSTAPVASDDPDSVVVGASPTPQPMQTCKADGGPFASSPTVSDNKLTSFDDLAAMRDTGPRKFATGTVVFNSEGRPASYKVAAGDTPYAIADRLCVDELWLDALNSVRRISSFSTEGSGPLVLYQGDTLNLDPKTIATVGDENGVTYHFTPIFTLPPQR